MNVTCCTTTQLHMLFSAPAEDAIELEPCRVSFACLAASLAMSQTHPAFIHFNNIQQT